MDMCINPGGFHASCTFFTFPLANPTEMSCLFKGKVFITFAA